MKINKKTRTAIDKLVDQFIKKHAEKDDTGKPTGENPILKVSTPNLVEFLRSEEFFKVSKIPLQEEIKRPRDKRAFYVNLNSIAKHNFKEKMDRKGYNEEFENDPTIMVENYKIYRKMLEEEELP